INEGVMEKASVEFETTARPVDAVMTYLETVHLVADQVAWQRLRAELLLMLDGGTQTQICAWLAEQRVVFPSCEVEVAAKIVMLAGSNTSDIEPRKPEPLHPVIVLKGKREMERQPNSFPRREPVYEEALAQQLALF
ncbi:MAG: hypothetical protein ABI835_20245, partial [Chloroflexota bacterium]